MNMWKVSTLMSVGIFALSPAFLFAQTAGQGGVTIIPIPNQETLIQEEDSFNLEEYIRIDDEMEEYYRKQESVLVNPKKLFEQSIRDNLEVLVNPPDPKPREEVFVSIESYSVDLEKAQISWILNGKTVQGGTAKKTLTFTTGEAGETTTLLIKIKTNLGFEVSKKLSWTPVGVTVLWEANTYTPPFYKGKPLATTQSLVRAIAVPDLLNSKNTSLSPGNLVFTWFENGESVGRSSGYNKNSFTFLAPKPYDDSKIELRVSSLNDSMRSSTEFKLPIAKPFILFYENHPLLGVWYNRPFGASLALKNSELSISAEPYFFSRDETLDDPQLLYAWTVNNKPVSKQGRLITLKNETGEAGSSSVSLDMRGLDKSSQKASRGMIIDFAEQNFNQSNF